MKTNESRKERKRLHALFSGRVQGVGFRFTTERIAQSYPIGGYVRNLPNGQVELVAEGEEKSLQEFLRAVQEAFHSHIQKTDVQWGGALGDFKDFGVKC